MQEVLWEMKPQCFISDMEKEQPIFTKEELEEIKILQSPILWAEKYLRDPMNPNKPFNLRWYQKEILSSKKKKKVIRAGRRCGKSVSMITEMLWKMYTRQYRKVVLITPYKSQIKELWDALNNMIEVSPEIKNSIKRKVNNPHELEFYNGSMLKAFTAGSKSSSKGSNIRSISAHDIYLDEADYLGPSALDAIEPLLLTSPDTTLWASSTPTGKRETFYNWVIRSKELGFDSFHYPSSVSPSWISIDDAKKKGIPITQSSEYYFKLKGESFYNHEILAEFGDEEEGVFKAYHLDNNIYDLNDDPEKSTLDLYDPRYKQNKKNTYTMGIDWNDSVNGTQIVITEYLNEPASIKYYEENENGKKIEFVKTVQNKFRLFYRCSISGQESTQLASVSKIIELINKYKIDHIYCDKGYGTTNIELLKEYGKQHKELQMDRKLVPIDFGSNVETIDPSTNEIGKQPMKPFIVYTAVHEVEKGDCILPMSEDDNGKLVAQMRAYSIKKHSQSGMPIFNQGNEHILTAWLLSILAFHMEYSTLIKPETNLDDATIARIRGQNILMPYLDKSERTSLKDSNNNVSKLFKDITPLKPMVPGNKVTTDVGFYNDTEKPNAYSNAQLSSPWIGQISKINNFSSSRKSITRASPTGRKLI